MTGTYFPNPAVFLDGQFKSAAHANNATYTFYYSRLALLARNIFEWEGLPDSCNSRYLEDALFWMGKAAFVNDPELGFLSTCATPAQELNIYNNPVSITAYGTGYTKQFSALPKDKEAIFIRNNADAMPTAFYIDQFAYRLYEIQRTIDGQIKSHKTPVIFQGTDKQRLSLKNLAQKYEGNEDIIFVSEKLNTDDIRVINPNPVYMADKIHDMLNKVWTDALTFLGINNANTDKRERLNSDEVNANNQMLDYSSNVFLLYRQEAAEEINKMFGLNISVKTRIDRITNLLDITGGDTEWQSTQQPSMN